MGWWSWLLMAWRNRRAVEQAGEAVVELVEEIATPPEPSQPLPYSAVEHNRAQERSAIAAAKAANAPKVDREAITPPRGRPIPPLPPSKRR